MLKEVKLIFLKNNCKKFAEDIETGDIKNKTRAKLWGQNLTALGFDDLALDVLTENNEADEEATRKAKKTIENWKKKNMFCYSCNKCGCDEAKIQKCQGKLLYSSDSTLKNSPYHVCAKSLFDKEQKILELEEDCDTIADNVLKGDKDLLSDDDTIKKFAELYVLNSNMVEKILEEFDTNKVKCKKFEKKLKSKANSIKVEKNSEIFSENTIVPELLEDYKEIIANITGYIVDENGHLYKIVQTKDGTDYQKISNSIPIISRKFIRNDGVEKTSYVEIHCIVNGTEVTEDFVIPVDELRNSNWVYKYFGTKVILETSSGYDSFRHFAQKLGESVETINITYGLGWFKDQDNKYGYCYSGKCIGSDNINVVQIEELGAYDYVNADIELADCYSYFDKFVNELIPDKRGISYTLAAYAFDSVLTNRLSELGIPPKFLIWLYGSTGSFKTEVAKIVTSFFGRVDIPPANFQDTAASMEKKLSLAGDCILLIDDFCPSSSVVEERGKIQKANTITRNIGDRVSRGRAKSNMELSANYRPRGGALITGEDIIGGTSTLSRHLCIPIARGDVKVEMLTELQEHKKELAKLMENYVMFVKNKIMDKCEYDLLEMFKSYRDNSRKQSHHRRFAESEAQLLLAYEIFTDFLKEKQLISEEQKAEMLQTLKVELDILIEEQNTLVNGEDVSTAFLTALKEMIVSGEIIVGNPNNAEEVGNKSVFREDDYYYLIPSVTYARVINHFMRKNQLFNYTERTVWMQLAQDNYIEEQVTKEKRSHYKIKKIICGSQTRCIKIKASILDSF